MEMGYRMRYALLIVVLLAVSHLSDARKTYSSGRKSSSSGSSSRRRTSNTQSPNPSYPKQANYDAAKLSYAQPSYTQPKPATNQQSGPIGWNVPKQETPVAAVNKPPSYAQSNMGPPPAYSPQNVPNAPVNRHEQPPAYSAGVQSGYPHANPPAYPGVQQSHAAPNYQQIPHQTGYAQPAGAAYPQQPIYNAQPAGVPYQQPSYYPAGSAPVLMTPQKSSSGSGLGFGTGLLAGGVAGGLLGHALTPSRDHDRVIVINNSDGSQTSNTPAPVAPGAPVAPAPMTPGVQPDPNMMPMQPPMAGNPYPVAPGPVPISQGAAMPMMPQQDGNGTTMVQQQETPVPLAAFPETNGGQTMAPLMPVMTRNLENAAPQSPFQADSLTATNNTMSGQHGAMCVQLTESAQNPYNPSETYPVGKVVCYNITRPDDKSQAKLVDHNTPAPLPGTIADRSSASTFSSTITFIGIFQAILMICKISA